MKCATFDDSECFPVTNKTNFANFSNHNNFGTRPFFKLMKWCMAAACAVASTHLYILLISSE